MLIGRFRYAAADDREIFFLVAARGVGIDKGCFARNEIAIADNACFHLFWGHPMFLVVRSENAA